MSKVFVAMILVAVEAADEGEAADAISINLREQMIGGEVLDWQYVQTAPGVFTLPLEVALTVDEGGDEEVSKQGPYVEAGGVIPSHKPLPIV